jgi:CubicO group peptidase (beta-lactamase class C family)
MTMTSLDPLSALAAPALAPDPDLSAVLAELAREADVPGAAAGVIHDGRVHVAVVGVTSRADPLPVEPDTLFLIGSTTKTFTATAVMALVEEGRLALDELVTKHLPGLGLDAETAETVTVEHLLTHRPGWRGDVWSDTGWGDEALAAAVDGLFPPGSQLFAPGAFASYNNAAFMIAGRLLEVLEGQPYEDVIARRVLEPLGMSNSWFLPWQLVHRRVAVGHRGDRPVPDWPLLRSLHPAGGAVSSLRDQLRYAHYQLTGATTGGAPVTPETRRRMQQPTVEMGPARVGISWLSQRRGELSVIRHGGNVANLHTSSFALVPDAGFAVTVLANHRSGGRLGQAVFDWAAERHLGRSAPPPPALPPLDAGLAAEVAGRYAADPAPLEVVVRDGRLYVETRYPEGREGAPPQMDAPPVEVHLVDSDRFVTSADPSTVAGEVIRDQTGRVAWLRWNLRLAPRFGR